MAGLRILKRIVTSKNFLPLLFIFFFTWVATKPLFGSGYFNMHDDLQMTRQLEMEKCFLDKQIPCRWVPDMGYGYGYPLFNFYPPLPYLTGELFRLVGYSFVDTAKALFILSFFASSVTMYFLGKEFFGRIGGTISSVFYVWAPYHAVDSYVRGAMNESWGLIWFPLILLASYKLLKRQEFEVLNVKKESLVKRFLEYLQGERTKWAILVSLSWAALFMSHNLMVIIFTPFFAVWCGIWLVYNRQWKSLLPLVIAGVGAIALAAFFSLPVLLEKDIVQTDTLVRGYYEYTAHFPSAAQLFISRFWGYGPSVWMTQDDKMSFQIGWFHWGISIVVGVLTVLRLYKTRKFDRKTLALLGLAIVAGGATFMAHPRSTPIWEHIKPLQFIQFPWRYLTMVILGTSFLAGGITLFFKKAKNFFLMVVLTFCVVIYGWNYFLPEHGHLGPLTDQEKFSGVAWELQQTAGIYDYLPGTAKTAPKAQRHEIAEVLDGDGHIHEGHEGTNWFNFRAHNESDEDMTVRINQFYFPNWEVTIDGNKADTFIPETEEWGRFYIKVPKGEHTVAARLYDTPVRTIGNIVTVISFIILSAILYIRYKGKNVTS